MPIPLNDVSVTVRPEGAEVYAMPEADAARLGALAPAARVTVQGVLFGDRAWLRVPWPPATGEDSAWIASDDTDFARSRAYEAVVDAWFEAGDVLQVRRKLAQDLLRLRKAPAGQIAHAATLEGDELHALEDTLTRSTVIAGYRDFWRLSEQLGLPEPFERLPVQIVPPAAIAQMVVDGFGPTTRAAQSGDVHYAETRGMSPGLEYTVPEGSPLIAVADGVIVDFPFLEHPAARSLALRPYLPPRFVDARGRRMLSNVLVAYGHLMGDPPGDLVQVGDEVRAGQVIGTSGWPIYERSDGSVGVQGNNAHLQLEVHLITDGAEPFGDEMPLNPLLFWSPRLVALQARLAAQIERPPYPRDHPLYGRLGFFTLGGFRTDLPGSVWDHTPTPEQPWPEGVYTLDALVAWLRTLPPYPLDGTSDV